MSGDCNITNVVSNTTGYTFSPVNPQNPLSSGNWVTSPQTIAAGASNFTAFEAIGVSGTATGAVGNATYTVLNSSNQVQGTATFNFSDPFDGSNSCSFSSSVQNLSATNNCPSSGRTITVNWVVST